MIDTIHKRQLCRRVAERLEVSPQGVRVVINSFLEELVDALKQGHRVELRGLGAFHRKNWRGRRLVGPRGGPAVTVPDSWCVGFTAGTKLRAMRDK